MAVLAELLNQRKAAFERAGELRERIGSESVAEEGDVNEGRKQSAQALDDELNDVAGEVYRLNVAINTVNNVTTVHFEDTNLSLMEAIALRDSLSLLHKTRAAAEETIDEAIGSRRGRHYYGRRSKDDVKEVPVIDYDDFRVATKAVADRLRRLDIEIQKANWSTET